MKPKSPIRLFSSVWRMVPARLLVSLHSVNETEISELASELILSVNTVSWLACQAYMNPNHQEGEMVIATGEYNRRIEERIAEIKQECGLG